MKDCQMEKDSIQKKIKYHGSFWRIVNDQLEDYLTRHPLTDKWYKHPTINNLEINFNGVFRLNKTKLTVGSQFA